MAADQGEVYMSNPGQTVVSYPRPCKEVTEQICLVETVSSLHEARCCVIHMEDL